MDILDCASQPANIRMTDVAKKAGVSLVTVSRAINHPDTVSSKTLAAVRHAVQELGYVPNLMAGSLASNRSFIIAAIVPTIANLVFAESIGALTETLSAGGYQLLLGQTNYSEDDERRLIDAFLGRRVDGLVLMGQRQDIEPEHSETRISNSLTERLRHIKLPVVQTWDLVTNPIDMQVGFSNFEAGHMAGSYLADRGYRTVGFIGADEARSHARLNGLKTAIEEQGGTVFSSLMPAPAGIEIADAQFAELLHQAPNLQSVFCNNDLLAVGVLFACSKRGIEVPRQMAVMGLGDMAMAQATFPRLTTIRVQPRRMGEMAASLLINRLAGNQTGSISNDIGLEIVCRDSA